MRKNKTITRNIETIISKDSSNEGEEEIKSSLKHHDSSILLQDSQTENGKNVILNCNNGDKFIRNLTYAEAKEDLCKIGTPNVKKRLKTLYVGDIKARLFRLMLNAYTEEEKEVNCDEPNIKETIYYKKIDLLYRIINLSYELKLNHGYLPSDVNPLYGGYFIKDNRDKKWYNIEMDGFILSWHCNTLDKKIGNFLLQNESKNCSAFGILEKLILTEFPEINNKKIKSKSSRDK